jgi:tRNA pseudouridine55 synthase
MTPSGLLVIDKPGGITSHGVVSVVRRALGTRKVGHAGTLDPMATGVLILGIERGTRLLGHLALHDKEYLATIRLGSSTVTDDREGEVLHAASPDSLAGLTDAQIEQAVARFRGEIEQIPSAVSAIKVDGKRAHALVRAGEDVVLKPRRVIVENFEVRSTTRSESWVDLEVVVACSTGTYVRALARDLGADLGVGGHLTELRRTRVGRWTVGEAVVLAEFVDVADPAAHVLSLGRAADRSFRTRTVSAAEASFIVTGRRIPWAEATDGEPGAASSPVALLSTDGHLLALAEQHDAQAKYCAVFAE